MLRGLKVEPIESFIGNKNTTNSIVNSRGAPKRLTTRNEKEIGKDGKREREKTSKNGRVIARFRVTSRAEGIQIEERSMTLEICIAINNEAGVSHIRLLCRTPNVRVMARPDYARFVIRDSSKLAIFYSYKICKQCKWTYSSNLYSSFNIRVNSLAERFFFDEIKGRESPRIAHSLAAQTQHVPRIKL